MSDRPPVPADDDPKEPPDGEARPARTPEPSGAALIGPAFGILLGYLVIKLLPSGTPFPLRLLAALVVIALVTYVTIEFTRRRARR